MCYAWMHNQKGINQWYLAEMMGTYGMVTCLQGSAVPHGFRQCTLSRMGVNRVETVLFKSWFGREHGMITCLQGLVVPMAHSIPVRVSKCTLSQHSDPILFNGICESRILGWNPCYAWMYNQK